MRKGLIIIEVEGNHVVALLGGENCESLKRVYISPLDSEKLVGVLHEIVKKSAGMFNNRLKNIAGFGPLEKE